MPTAKEISKTIGKILIGSIMAGVVGGAINYALTPDEEKNINKSIQFGVMTFGALLMSQITHLVFNQMLQEHAISSENWGCKPEPQKFLRPIFSKIYRIYLSINIFKSGFS